MTAGIPIADYRIVADGLRFPEGPVCFDDGSVVLVEIETGVLTRVAADGRKTTVATPGDGPNGLPVGPDGAFYLCNNGGFAWTEHNGLLASPSIRRTTSASPRWAAAASR